jgi:hypothetical protein
VLRHGMAVLIGAATIVGSGWLPAQADSPWTHYRAQDFSLDAGTACGFAISSEVVKDKERYRTTAYFEDGSPRYQEFTGQLVVRFTNLESGESVVRNLTGRGDFEYFADGGFALHDRGGHFAAAMYPGDDPGPGVYVVSGRGWTLRGYADGSRELIAGKGTVENVCDTLA